MFSRPENFFRGVFLSSDEVFVSSGASDELGDILDLFDRSGSALVIEPAYPAYVDANVMAGRKIVHLASGEENGFLPEPSEEIKADLLYICSPNNPTGAVFSRNQLQAWVDFANENDSIILFEALPVGARRATRLSNSSAFNLNTFL